MPTYEYECRSCRRHVDVRQAMTARPLRKCPRCGTLALRRLIGAGSGLIFKGSGFYVTDYRKPGDSAKARADAEKPSTTSSKPSGKGSPATADAS